ncbi:hypothetical protein [Acinetobacter rongchengensis]|uniref:Uncharacterized protein n=1 Tax=Acinetobacter rongchengensis TaxID=2419601 RepID=A0A3A8ESY5_9GAMM|nr:hypothetical protein [Acinetobacter rongchengensis]RKG37259.1 hypothetical protein D7V20_11595 [Acinetobacter rongchengensis]
MDHIKYFLFSFLILIIFAKLIILPVNEYFILPNYLEYKSKHVENIKNGYACYEGKYKTRSGNYVYEYRIGNSHMTSFSGLKVKFPFSYKRGEFFNKIEINSPKCIFVDYVEIDYFFINAKYVYDFNLFL